AFRSHQEHLRNDHNFQTMGPHWINGYTPGYVGGLYDKDSMVKTYMGMPVTKYLRLTIPEGHPTGSWAVKVNAKDANGKKIFECLGIVGVHESLKYTVQVEEQGSHPVIRVRDVFGQPASPSFISVVNAAQQQTIQDILPLQPFGSTPGAYTVRGLTNTSQWRAMMAFPDVNVKSYEIRN
ncbi:MAG: hypothetical protein AAF202_06375, partial [Pseudomonadota bacterium]